MRTGIAALAALLVTLATGEVDAEVLETIGVGAPALAAVRMPTTTDTVDNYVVTGGVRQATGATVRTIALREEAVEPVFEIRTVHWTAGGDTSISTMVVRARDLSLVSHRVKAPRDSAAVTASRNHLTGWVVLPNRPVILLDRTLEHPVFGVEGQIPWLLPLLPLAVGYRAAVSHFSQWDGGEGLDTVAVLGSEHVTIGARSIDCWKVDTGALGPPGYRMVRWIEKQSLRIAQSSLIGVGSDRQFWSYRRP